MEGNHTMSKQTKKYTLHLYNEQIEYVETMAHKTGVPTGTYVRMIIVQAMSDSKNEVAK